MLHKPVRKDSSGIFAWFALSVLFIAAGLLVQAASGGQVHQNLGPASYASSLAPAKTNLAGGVTYNSGGASPSSVLIADVNRDSNPDLVMLNVSTVGVLLGNGDGTFQPALTSDIGGSVSYGSGNVGFATADLNRDGKLDLVVTTVWPTNTFRVLLGNGDGTFQPVSIYDTFGGPAVAIADVNGDRIPDLLIASSYPDSVGVLLGNGDGTFKDPVSYAPGGTYTDGIAVGDVNSDGKPDLVVSNFGDDGMIGVLLGNGDGTFQPPTSYWTGGSYSPEAYSPTIIDVNHDGKQDVVDVVVGNWASGSIGVLLGNGDGTFQPAVTFRNSGYTSSIAVADMDGDGNPDVLAANSSRATIDVLLGNGDGSFRPPVTYDTSRFWFSGSYSVAAADLNRDGKVDAAAAVLDPNSVSVLLNNTGAPPATTILISTPNPVPKGHAVTYTVTVVGQPGLAVSGWVKFQDATTTIAAVPLTNSQAGYRTTYTKGGTHTITATYSGDLHNARSTSTSVVQHVSSIPSKTIVNTSAVPSLIYQPVTFSVTVSSTEGPIPNGDLVTFADGSGRMGSVVLVNGTASFSTSSLAVRTHTIRAIYAGDATFMPSVGTVTQVVNKYPTATTLSSSLNQSLYGQNLTFTAQVTPTGSAPPVGNVIFRCEGGNIGVTPLTSGGTATLSKSKLNAGNYSLTALFPGDSVNAKSTSNVVNLLIAPTTSNVSITSSQNPSAAGQVVTFTAAVSSPTVLPGGTVIFRAGTTQLGTAPLSHGKAQIKISSLPIGATKVTATYNGDSNISGSAASITQKVQP
jgi:hypothetical protein